jgi:hypothetical protein
VLATRRYLAPLVGLVEAVDELLPTDGLGPLRWDREPPALAVNLHGAGPESTGFLLALNPKRLLTHAHPALPSVPGPQWVSGQHEVRRWCRLLAYAGIASDRSDLFLRRPRNPSMVPGATVIHPGASHRSRQWPAWRYATVARQLAEDGHNVVVTGSADERDLALSVARDLPEANVLAGELGLDELAAVVADASLVVCGDTGIGHLATAYRTPSVRLFGPVAPKLWGPPDTDRRHTVLWRGRAGDTFADRPDPGLLDIAVPEVLDAARRQFAACKNV